MRHILAALFLFLAVTLAVRAPGEYLPGSGALPGPPPGGTKDYGAYEPPYNQPPERRFPAPAPYLSEPSRPYSTAPEGIYPSEGRAAYGAGYDRLDPRNKLPGRQ